MNKYGSLKIKAQSTLLSSNDEQWIKRRISDCLHVESCYGNLWPGKGAQRQRQIYKKYLDKSKKFPGKDNVHKDLGDDPKTINRQRML